MTDLNNNSASVKRHKFTWKRLLIWGGSFIALIILAGVLFIEFDTEVAANFSDDILRPLLGNNTVIVMEKIYFNTSDKIAQLFSSFKKEKSPISTNGNVLLPSEKLDKGTLNFTPIATTAENPLDKEGEWQNLPLTLFPGQVVMADTFIRPDPTRPYAFVTLVQIDMSKLHLFSVAGTKEPGGKVGLPGPGVIPKTVRDKGELVAAFDGGFQYRDGQYGMIVDDVTYLPLKNDLATLVGHKDGRLEIVKYEEQDLGNDISFVRQNCPMLIENGTVAANDVTNRKLWGRTTTWQIYTWRSGLGITKEGNLIFAIGNSLISSTLADALLAAGAVNAMQLDINPNWVRFNLFDNFAKGKYSSRPIIDGIKDGSYEYLHGDRKDFFYLTKK